MAYSTPIGTVLKFTAKSLKQFWNNYTPQSRYLVLSLDTAIWFDSESLKVISFDSSIYQDMTMMSIDQDLTNKLKTDQIQLIKSTENYFGTNSELKSISYRKPKIFQIISKLKFN